MSFIRLESISEKVKKIVIDKEKSLNALNQEVLEELDSILKSDDIKKCKVLFFEGAGDKAFVAGADIAQMKEFSSVKATKFSQLGNAVFTKLESLKCITVSLVDGFALGGGFEFSLATDIILATEKSKFGLPEVSLGLIPGFGGTQRLSRSLGLHYAKALTLTGDMISAQELHTRGLIYKVFASSEEMKEYGEKLSKTLLSKGPHALYVAKSTIQKGASMPFDESLELEMQEFSLLFGTSESKEGIDAFLEKRKPNFNS